MDENTLDKYGSLWSRDELVLALYLYCQIPFSKTKTNNPEVNRLASLIGRTPASVARKLGNFGAFDPRLKDQGIEGLGHNSKMDSQIWEEFYQRWDSLVREAQGLLSRSTADDVQIPEDVMDTAPIISRAWIETEQKAVVMVRLCQSFFRRSVLSSYDYQCCICSLDLQPLLVASHIVPWATNTEYRPDPENGLCLCTLHDRAFDRGLLSLSSDLKIVVSGEVRDSQNQSVQLYLREFQGQSIRPPKRFPPRADCLDWHLNTIFRG